MHVGALILTLLVLATNKGPFAPEVRAIAYLSREVPRWSVENKCYSCHNNGDAARALYAARRAGYHVPPQALEDTTRWLLTPEKWEDNGGQGPFIDEQLTRLQFALALFDAIDDGIPRLDERPLRDAARLLASHQKTDGSWQIDAANSLGSPATYGSSLATYLASWTLRRADAIAYREATDKADRWLAGVPVKTSLDAAAKLFAFGQREPRQTAAAFDWARQVQSPDGGWGPYQNSPPEAFDTAIVLLALKKHEREDGVAELIRRGRAFLVAAQRPDGSWIETTRPAGAESYAQRLSTAGWATLALLATRPR